jgi:hypothetical protein
MVGTGRFARPVGVRRVATGCWARTSVRGLWDRRLQWCTGVCAWSVGGRADAARRARDVARWSEPVGFKFGLA